MTEPNDNWYSPAQIVDPLPGYRVPTVPTKPTNYLDASRPYVDTTEQTFLSTLGDRAIFGSTEGGAGRWLFGALGTPQRFVVDQILGVDETIDDQFIANRSQNAMEFIDSMDEMTKRILVAAGNDRPGGYDQMLEDLVSTSTSRQNLASRINTINEIYKAKQRIDAYDAGTNFASYAFIKTASGVLNYATVDPLIVAPLGATAVTTKVGTVAARSVATGTAVSNLTRAQRIGYFFEQHRNYAFAADLLWNTMDGAQAGYSNFVSYNLDQQKIYGSSDTDENWTDNVLAGAGIAAGFTVGTHLLTAGLRSPGRPGREEAISNMRDLEQLGAHSNQHLSTPSDIVFQDRMYRARTDLEGVVGLTEDSESAVMRTIRSPEEMSNLGYRNPDQIQELADWIRTNRPSSTELGEKLTEKARLRDLNNAEAQKWQSEVDDWVAAGGEDPAQWYGMKAAEYLRRIVGNDEYGNYKWMLDWFKNRAGGVDNEALARWLMNADKDNLDRLVAMRDLEARISKVEGKALKDSLDEISRRRGEHWDDAIAADHQKAIDDINEARWFEAVESLERMWEKQKARAGSVLANLDSLIDEANRADRSWGRNLNRKLKSYRNVVDAANRLKEMINGRILYPQEGTNRILNGLMDPDATAGDLHVMAREAIADDARRMDPGNMNSVSQASREEFEAVQQQLLKAVENMHKFEDRTRSLLGTKVSNLRSVYRKTGDLRREFSMEFGLPVDQYHMTFNGFRTVMKGTARTVVDSQRHNVSLVDNVYGAGAAEGYLARGEFPSRPVRRTTVVRPLLDLDEEMAIFEKNLGDQVERIRREAADNPSMDAKRAAKSLESRSFRESAERARNIANNSILSPERRADILKLADKFERKAKSVERAAKRIMTELEKRAGTFQPPPRPTIVRISELPGITARNTRAAERISQIGAELSKLDDIERRGSRGAKLRADLRKAKAKLGAQTAFDTRRRLLALINEDLSTVQKRVDDLVNEGNADRAPVLVQARKELEQITRDRDSLQSTILRTENAQVVFQRRSSLHGNAPRSDDVVALSRLMAAINAAQAAGKSIASLSARLYDEFGNVANLPRWVELEDAYQEAIEAIQRGERPPLITVNMIGRDAEITINKRTPTVFEDTFEESVSTLKSSPKTVVKEAAAKTKKKDPVKATGKEAVDERKAALSAWLDGTAAGGEGDRLVATNRLMASMAQIPIMRNLGAGLLRLMTAGTGFGRVHGVARDLDALVTMFNMLDRPEATERAHGLIGNIVHTLETHRNKGRMFLNRAAAAAQNAGLSYSTPEAWTRINAALDTGDTSGLSGPEVNVYNALRQAYDYYADSYRTIYGRDPQVEHYRPRFPIVDQIAGNRTQAAQQFRDVYAERMRTPGNELPPEICDEIGVPRGTGYDPTMGAAVETAIDNLAARMGTDSVNRLSNSMTTDGMGGWRYTYSTNSARGRVLENEVFNDPRLSRYFIQHPLEGLRQYINTTGPEMSFHAQLCRMTGQTNVSFNELLDIVAERFARLNDPEVTAEAANVIRLIREKADMAFGRTQYTHTDLLDTGFRSGNGIIKTTTGSFWGMAGMLGEVPRAMFASRHGGPIRGLIEAMQALHRTNDLDAIQDVAHAVDQYTTMTHSHTGAGSSVGLTAWDRFVEPWRRFRNVAIGSESELHYGTNQTMGRIKGTTIAGLEALGESAVRGGLLQWASGFARVTADRMAKRHLVRNIRGMRTLAEELEAIGPVARQTPETARRFREAAARAGLDYDVALRMNHSGLLTREVVDQLENALSLPGVAPSGVFELNRLQGIGERAYMGLVSYLTDAHNFHVPTAGLAQSVPVSNALGKLYYQLTSYSRAFSTTIGMRGAINMPLTAAALTFGAVMLGETLYQNSRDVAKGKKTWDDVMTEYDDNPMAFYFKNGLKSPWLGGHHSTYMSAVDAVTPGKMGFDSTRGNSAFSTILSSYSQIARQVSEKEPDEASFNILKSHTPVVNAWYSRLLMESFK